MPRIVRLLHSPHLLAQDAVLPRRRQPTQGALRRRSQGHPQQRRPPLHPRGRHHQASGSRGPGLLRGVAGLLQSQPQDGVTGHAGEGVQRDVAGGRRLRAPLLRERIQDSQGLGEGQL